MISRLFNDQSNEVDSEAEIADRLYPTDPNQKWPHGAEQVKRALELTLEALRSLQAVDEREPVRETRSPDELTSLLNLALSEKPKNLNEVVNALTKILSHTPSTSSRHFFNQLFGGRDPAALVGDLFATFGNQSVYTYKVAAPIVLIEDVLLQKLGTYAGFASDHSRCGGIFTPGGSLSNLAAMLCARDRFNPSWRETGGLSGRIYTSAESHYSVRKGAGIIGLGRDHVVKVGTLPDGGLDPDHLKQCIQRDLAEGLSPMMVVATAGTTVRGSFDPFDSIATICEDYNLWMHVDGAFGGTALLSPSLSTRMRGVNRADSLTWDAHKAMGAPLTCSVLLTRDEQACHRALSESASYLFQGDGDLLNPGTRSLQCGRRNDALKLWSAWLYYGDHGWSKRIERQRNLALKLAEEVKARPRLRLCEDPPYLNVCFEVVSEDGAPQIDHRELCQKVQLNQDALVGYATFKGSSALDEVVIRAAVINPDITTVELRHLLDSIERVAFP